MRNGSRVAEGELAAAHDSHISAHARRPQGPHVGHLKTALLIASSARVAAAPRAPRAPRLVGGIQSLRARPTAQAPLTRRRRQTIQSACCALPGCGASWVASERTCRHGVLETSNMPCVRKRHAQSSSQPGPSVWLHIGDSRGFYRGCSRPDRKQASLTLWASGAFCAVACDVEAWGVEAHVALGAVADASVARSAACLGVEARFPNRLGQFP